MCACANFQSHHPQVLVLGSDLCSAAFADALHAALRALLDGLGMQSFNCGVLNLDPDGLKAPLSPQGAAAASQGGGAAAAQPVAVPAPCDCDRSTAGAGEASEQDWGLPRHAGWRPLVARVVSRGRWAAPASDFGALEVLGHASIGATDPFRLIRAVEEQLSRQHGA